MTTPETKAREVAEKILDRKSKVLVGGYSHYSYLSLLKDIEKALFDFAASENKQMREEMKELAKAARHWSCCDMPDELEFRCQGCIDGEEALARFKEK